MATNEKALKLASKIRKAWNKGKFCSYSECAAYFGIKYHLCRRIILGTQINGSLSFPEGNYREYRVYGKLYIIYDDGRVWSTTTGRFLNNWNKKGYKVICLRNPTTNKKSNVLVSRLMLTLFDRPPVDGEVARHLDDDPSNNCLSNLSWGTYSDNTWDSIRNGTQARGETGGRTKLNTEMVLRLVAEFDGTKGFLETFIKRHNLDVVPLTLDHILKGKNWSHITGLPLIRGSIYSHKPMDIKAVYCLHSSWSKSNLTQLEFCEKFARYLKRKGYTGITKNSVLKALRGKTFSKVYNELSGT